MKFLKKAVSILAACGIAIAAIPFSAIPADAAILYSLDDGVLTIKSPEVIEKYHGMMSVTRLHLLYCEMALRKLAMLFLQISLH